MFGKSFSNFAVERASIHLKCLHNRSSDLFILYPPFGDESSISDDKNSNEKFVRSYNSEPKKKLAFASGFAHTICAYFFDGQSRHLDEFIKRVVVMTFNEGFMMNNGKSMYKRFSSPEYKSAEYYQLGCDWAQSYYIEKFFLEEKGTIDELLSVHEAKEHYYSERFLDPELAFDSAKEAKITRKEHTKWCSDLIDKIESDFSKNACFSENLMNELRELRGNKLRLTTPSLVYLFYEDLCSATNHQKKFDIIKTYDPDNYISDDFDEEDDLEFADALNFDEEARYQQYLTLWQIEKNLPQSRIFSPEFLDEVSSLDFITEIMPKIENEELKQAYHDYMFAGDLRFYLEIFGSIHHLFSEQGLESECMFLVGVHKESEDLKFYPQYTNFKFFELKSQILKNNGRFNYTMVEEEFPKFGRMYVHPNLQLGITIKLLNDNEYFDVPRSIVAANLNLNGEVDHDEIIKMKTKIDKLWLSQERLSINHQLEHGYGNSSGMGFKKLEELINDWKHPEYWFASEQKKVFEFINANEKKLLDKLKLEKQYAELTDSNLVVEKPGLGDLQWDAIFEIYRNSKDKRSTYFSETGLLYDPFEYEHLKKFKEMGLPVNPQLLRKGFGILPITVKIALRIERLFLYLSTQTDEEIKKYADLIYNSDEYPN